MLDCHSATNVPVGMPWAAWYGDTVHELQFPRSWTVDVLSSDGGPALSEAGICRALDLPIDSPALEQLARAARNACIAVDDLARPTQADKILPHLLERLGRGGLTDDKIHIVVATGTHGIPDRRALEWKVGSDLVQRGLVEVHGASSDLADTGIEYGNRPLRLNRRFLEADLKLSIGAVLPHAFAGFSGGAKMLLPGLADLAAAARLHKFAQMGLRRGSGSSSNSVRREIEQIARQVGFNFTVNVVPNSSRETSHLFVGDVVAAHRCASEFAVQVYQTRLCTIYDALILNAFPKDIDLVQAANVFVALRALKKPPVRDGGLLVVTSAASEGLGRHGLFAPGGVSYQKPRPSRVLGHRRLVLYVPTLDEKTARHLYCSDYIVCRTSEELVRVLRVAVGDDARIGVLPCAPMQLLDDCREH